MAINPTTRGLTTGTDSRQPTVGLSAILRRSGFALKSARRCAAGRLVCGLASAIRRMSRQRCYSLSDHLASILYYLYPRLRDTSLRHLRLAFGDPIPESTLGEIALRSLRLQCRTLVEVLRMPIMTDQELIDSVSVSGSEYLDEALAMGHGAIVVTAHFGNWEFMAARMSRAGYPANAIASDREDRELTALVNDIRHQSGIDLIGRSEIRKALQCLRRNEVLGILADQNLRNGGVWVEFFGHPAISTTGPAVLATRTGAQILPAFIVRDQDNHHHISFQPPLDTTQTGNVEEDIQRITQLVSKAIEEQITLHPDHWLWTHRRWRRAEKLGLI